MSSSSDLLCVKSPASYHDECHRGAVSDIPALKTNIRNCRDESSVSVNLKYACRRSGRFVVSHCSPTPKCSSSDHKHMPAHGKRSTIHNGTSRRIKRGVYRMCVYFALNIFYSHISTTSDPTTLDDDDGDEDEVARRKTHSTNVCYTHLKCTHTHVHTCYSKMPDIFPSRCLLLSYVCTISIK